MDDGHMARGPRRVQELVAVGGIVRLDPPGPGIVGGDELRALLHDLEGPEGRLLRQHVPESHPVVEHTEDHLETPPGRHGLLHVHRQFVVVIAYGADLAPRLFPRLVLARPDAPGDGQIFDQGLCRYEFKAQARREKERRAVPFHPVEEPRGVLRSGLQDFHGDHGATVG
jgi:hypothetical protein